MWKMAVRELNKRSRTAKNGSLTDICFQMQLAHRHNKSTICDELAPKIKKKASAVILQVLVTS
jgi:hypothetical protein